MLVLLLSQLLTGIAKRKFAPVRLVLTLHQTSSHLNAILVKARILNIS